MSVGLGFFSYPISYSKAVCKQKKRGVGGGGGGMRRVG